MPIELADALPPPGRNAILEALGTEARHGMEDVLSEVELDVQQPLSAEEEGVEGIYFPISCLMCRLVSLPEGTSVKVSIVGREGMTGTSAFVDTSVSAFRTVVQLPGRAMFLPRSQAPRLLELAGVAPVLVRYLMLLVREASLTAACNRAHPAKERLARWLLLIGDRAGVGEFPLTQSRSRPCSGYGGRASRWRRTSSGGLAPSSTAGPRSPSPTGGSSRSNRVPATPRSPRAIRGS